jgi:hypothetical protein
VLPQGNEFHAKRVHNGSDLPLIMKIVCVPVVVPCRLIAKSVKLGNRQQAT